MELISVIVPVFNGGALLIQMYRQHFETDL